jgi:hypothetical protein
MKSLTLRVVLDSDAGEPQEAAAEATVRSDEFLEALQSWMTEFLANTQDIDCEVEAFAVAP